MAPIGLKATESEVHAVTIFRANRAEVVRYFNVDLKAGQNEVDISQLPTVLDEDSIRVDGIGGDAIISDVIYHPPTSSDSDKKHELAVKELERDYSTLKNKLTIFRKQASILETYSKTLKGADTDGEQLDKFLDVFEKRQDDTDTKIAEVEDRMTEVNAKIEAERKVWNTDNEGKKRAVRITIVIFAEEEGPAEISLTYLVSRASWTPIYDLRASIKPKETSISLQYRAKIVQSTGEDWNEVELTLSTASPQLGSTIPKLTPLWIKQGHSGTYAPIIVDPYRRRSRSRSPVIIQPPSSRSRRSRSRSRSPRSPRYTRSPSPCGLRRSRSPRTIVVPSRFRSRSRSPSRRRLIKFPSHSRSPSPTRVLGKRRSYSPDGKYEPLEYNRGTARYTQGGGRYAPEEYDRGRRRFVQTDALPVEGTISTSYTIDGLSTIPSDTDLTSQAHKVNVAVIDIPADLEWIAVPKEKPSAFLQAKVKNTSPYMFLRGQANIFLENNFVAKSVIENVSPNESFNCSLGVDPQVKVIYHPRTKQSRSQGGLLVSRTVTTVFHQKITLKNTRGTPIKRLLVRDQVPISSDRQLKVSIMEPAELDFSNRTSMISGKLAEKGNIPKELEIGKGVSVRWKVGDNEVSDTASALSADGVREGILEWVCNIDAGKTTELNLAWDVNAPAGLNWGPQ